MRNLYKCIITSVALVVSALSFGSVALAQQAPVVFDKYVSGPNENGVFTINLEVYAPGSVELKKDPFDIILVLDRSGSMRYGMTTNSVVSLRNQRISKLKESVHGFVKYLQENAPDQEDARGGHRIAFVWFSGEDEDDEDAIFTGTGLNEFQKVNQLSLTAASSSGDTYEQAKVSLGNSNLLLDDTPSGGTFTNLGMEKAYSILNNENTANPYSNTPDRKRIVVFFTDGEPGSFGWNGGGYGQWYRQEALRVANGCIRAAYNIKNSNAFGASVYSIGLFDVPETTRDRTTTYLSYTSSDYKDKREMPSSSSSYVTVSNNYSILVSDSEKLNAIFTTIAHNTSSAGSGSSVLVDVVTSDFRISAPVGSDPGKVTVWEVPCTQPGANLPISFSPKYDEDNNLLWTNITSSVRLDATKIEQGEISVTNYDYAANWCGWNAETGQAHGNKLLLEIPISVNDGIVGGPNTQTNLPGSGITVKNAAGEPIGTYLFPIPVVKIPVTIMIKKEGLLSGVPGHEDNAVFTIRKTKFLGVYETNSAGEVFQNAKRIDYTYSKDATKKFIVNGVETEIKWTTFTKVSVNMTMKEDDQYGIVKISGLDADYIYRIEEDAWAHLGYTFDPDATARYTLEWDETAGEYKEPTNPFVFSNTSKTNAFYSEDVVRNVFNQGTTPTN